MLHDLKQRRVNDATCLSSSNLLRLQNPESEYRRSLSVVIPNAILPHFLENVLFLKVNRIFHDRSKTMFRQCDEDIKALKQWKRCCTTIEFMPKYLRTLLPKRPMCIFQCLDSKRSVHLK